MRRSDSIFASRAERDSFVSLKSRWAPKLALYPQLPLANLVQFEPEDRLTATERQFFFDTNVDYAFCTPTVGRPVIAIEFDGIGGGYSSAGSYDPIRAVRGDPKRSLQLDFKLRCCHSAGLPFVVVSYDELERVDESEWLTVLDGIVAQFVSRQALDRPVPEFYEHDQAMIDSIDPESRDELLQDLVLEAELKAELGNDPLAQARADACAELLRFGDAPTESTHWLFDPPLPDPSPGWASAPVSVSARSEAWTGAQRVGVRAEVPTRLGTTERTVWIRNVGQLDGVNPHHIAEQIALLQAFRAAAAQLGEYFEPIR